MLSSEPEPPRAECVPAPVRRDRHDVVLALLLAVLLLLAVAVPQVRGLYPLTYDELVPLGQTRAYDQWLREGWAQARAGNPAWLFSPAAWDAALDLPEPQPAFASLTALLPHWLVLATMHRAEGARLVGALFLALAAVSLYWFLAPRAGRPLAWLGALAFALMPRLFGRGHLAALDVPVMAMVFLAALVCRRAALRNTWGSALGAAVVLGLALGTAFPAALLVPYLVLWLVLYRPPGLKKLVICALPLAPLVFLASWPWLWSDPLGRLAQYLAGYLGHQPANVLYFGRVYDGASTLPATVPLVMLAVTLPVLWLVLLAGAVPRLWRPRDETSLFLWLGLLAGLGLALVPRVAGHGGDRLILPVLPFVAALALLTAHRWAEGAGPANALSRVTAVLLGGALLASSLSGIAATYPYCLSYYSPLIGGLPGAQRLGLEVTSAGEACYGATSALTDPANAGARFYAASEAMARVLDGLVAVGQIPSQHRFAGRYVTDHIPLDGDWIIVDNAPACWSPTIAWLVRARQPALTVSRQGVPLLWLFHLEHW